MDGDCVTLELLNERLERIERLTLIGAKEVLCFDEALLLTGFSRGHLYRLTSKREIPHFKKGRKVYFRKAELEDWMLEDKVPTLSEVKTKAAAFIANRKRERNSLKRMAQRAQ